MPIIKVLLADDWGLFLEGVKSVLRQATGDIEIVGEATNGEEAVQLTRRLDPAVVLMDQDLPKVDGIEATRAIKQAMPAVEIIIMTERLDDTKALAAIEAGAAGYILKDIPAASLLRALNSVRQGQAFFHPEVTRTLIERLGRLARDQRTRFRSTPEGLTARELEVLVELTSGSTDRQIATKFRVSEGTVKTHIRNILHKLNCRNRTQAVAYALRKGFIK
ncbi:MAG: response regulator transcription factor [Bacillati bacterium ANGP1]|uniref:Response regulator transcription factor n=1 Tax=Candidatus Segetimicrobium genomatis TaxID=2569760 RepID=A0A537KTB4_9BACT|nr:MAG: response regulator transcription factor [Terrabacteria group bacterium ANGP1]